MYSTFHLQASGDHRDGMLADGLRTAQAACTHSQACELSSTANATRQFEFLGFIAHELRNPLAPIRTAAALLSLGRPEDVARAQAVIERQVNHMGRMIEDLLDMARGRTGKLDLVLESLDLCAVVEQSAAACQAAMSRRNQHLETAGLDASCPLRADAMRLTQIITNLIDNASKFSSDGGTVHVVVRRLAQSVELVVSDEGLGMDAATLANVFNPFAQAAHAVGFNKSGLGIGLAVVRQLTESHGGRVAAASRGIGHGSCFTVTLPVSEADAVQFS
jgi:signal transduction histidine kinase